MFNYKQTKKLKGDKNNKNIDSSDRMSKLRKDIIRQYIEISEYLELRGANSDFSLTPKEFEVDATKKYDKIELILDEITNIYEFSRFSDSEVTEEMHIRMTELLRLIKIEFESQ